MLPDHLSSVVVRLLSGSVHSTSKNANFVAIFQVILVRNPITALDVGHFWLVVLFCKILGGIALSAASCSIAIRAWASASWIVLKFNRRFLELSYGPIIGVLSLHSLWWHSASWYFADLVISRMFPLFLSELWPVLQQALPKVDIGMPKAELALPQPSDCHILEHSQPTVCGFSHFRAPYWSWL